jgi:hypothetical protein
MSWKKLFSSGKTFEQMTDEELFDYNRSHGTNPGERELQIRILKQLRELATKEKTK